MFQGTLTALVTPFKVQTAALPEIDYQALEGLIEWQIECGVSGLVVGGTTGESATLEPEERLELIRRFIDVTKGRVPVIAGTGTNSTRTSVELTKAACELNVDGVLIVAPYYNKPTQEGLFRHYQTVAAEAKVPVVVYNIPGRSSVEISVETLDRLSRIDNIVAVKDATGSATKLMELRAAVGDRLDILSGEDSLTYLIMAAGGKGVISASANVIPELFVEITSNCKSDNFTQALSAQLKALPVIRALFAETNPAPAKAALKILGRIENEVLRLPLVSVKSETRELLKSVLQQVG